MLLEEFTRRSGTVIFNAKKVRITSDPLLDESRALTAVHIQPTRYFDTLITNDSLSVVLWSERNHREVFDGSAYCFPGRTVPECSESSCANQVGASTLAITSDGFVVVTEQGRMSNIAPGQLTSSGSGSADWRDARGAAGLSHFVRRVAGRELIEECGLKPEDIEWLKILGYGRFLHRGGLPQFFCLAKLRCDYASLHVTRPERPLTNGHLKARLDGDPLNLKIIIDGAARPAKAVGAVSTSLWWNLVLLSHVQEGHAAERWTS